MFQLFEDIVSFNWLQAKTTEILPVSLREKLQKWKGWVFFSQGLRIENFAGLNKFSHYKLGNGSRSSVGKRKAVKYQPSAGLEFVFRISLGFWSQSNGLTPAGNHKRSLLLTTPSPEMVWGGKSEIHQPLEWDRTDSLQTPGSSCAPLKCCEFISTWE